MPGAWELPATATDIVLGVPYSAACPLTFDYLASLINLQRTVRTQLLSWKGLPVDISRNQLARDALEKGAQYLFFVDSDVLVPPEALALLLRWRLPIVAGVYYTKRGYMGLWRRDPDDPNKYNPITQVPTGGLMEVDATATGVMLIDTRVFKIVPEEWFVWTSRAPRVSKGLSEDINFCRKAQDHGLRIFVDPQCRCDHEMLLAVDTEGKAEHVIFTVKPEGR